MTDGSPLFPGRDESVSGTRARGCERRAVCSPATRRGRRSKSRTSSPRTASIASRRSTSVNRRSSRSTSGRSAAAARRTASSGIRTVRSWVPRCGRSTSGSLSECGVAAPSIDLVPRRIDEIVTPGTDHASYPWSVGDAAAARTAGPNGWCRPSFRPGDALLFDDKLLHRTGGDPGMTQTRYAIETWFFRAFGRHRIHRRPVGALTRPRISPRGRAIS